MQLMKTGKVLHILLIALTAMFLSGHILLNNKKIQQNAALHVVRIAQAAIGTDVSAGRVQLTYPFGITIEGLTVYDLNHDTLAHAASVSMYLKPMQLLRHKVSITSVRVNSPSVRLKADSIGMEPNYAFLTALAGNSDEPMKLRANSVLIRNGSVSYDILSEQQTDSLFNPSHIGVSSLTANLSLKEVSRDSISVIIRKLTFAEQSGFKLAKAKGAVTIGKDFSQLSGLTISTPSCRFEAARLSAGIGLASQLSGLPDIEMDLRTTVTASDFKAFMPQLAGMTAPVDINVNGSSRDGNMTLNALYIHTPGDVIDLSMSGTVLMDTALNITGCRYTEAHGTFSAALPAWLESQLSGFGLAVPSKCAVLGDGSFKTHLESTSGNLAADFELVSQAGIVSGSIDGVDSLFNGTLRASDIDLKAITSQQDLDRCSLTAQAQFRRAEDGFNGTFTSNIESLVYRRYRYRNIALNGSFSPGHIQTGLDFTDRNGALNLESSIGYGQIPFCSIKLDADSLNLAAYHIAGQDSMSLTTTVTANLIGNSIDNINGKISVDSLYYADREGDWAMNNLTVSIGQFNDLIRVMTVYSDFFNVSLVGDYRLSRIPGSLAKACSSVLPTIGGMVGTKLGADDYGSNSNSFAIEANLDNTDFMQKVFHRPVSIGEPAHLQMTFIDDECFCMGHLSVPSATIAGKRLSDAQVNINSADSTCHAQITAFYGESATDGISINTSLLAFADIVRAEFSWSDATGYMRGTAKTLSQFYAYNRYNGLKSVSYLDTTNVTVNGTEWNLSIARVATDRHKISISDFCAGNENQYLYADGTVSADSSDVIRLSMNNIDLDRTLSVFGINDALRLEGIASGSISVAEVLGNPIFDGSFTIDGFRFMDSSHGRLTAYCRWNRHARRVEINGDMLDEGISSTRLNGIYMPDSKFIDVSIDADHTDMHFLNTWTKSAFNDIDGQAIGQLRLFGNLPHLDLEGQAILENGRFVQDAVKTAFIIKHDTLWFEPGRMLFKDVEFYDEKGHDGLLTCILNHDHFSNWRVDMTADVANMLVYDQPKSDKSDIYASVYAEGSMDLKYDKAGGLAISVNARTAPGTRIGYKPATGTVTDYKFLTIVDRNTVKINEETVRNIIPAQTKNGKRFSLDFDIECSEDALIEMSMPSLNGFFRGNGDISFKYNPKDGPDINGIYNLSYGQCAFSLEDVIRKNFTLADGSYVRFNGSPMDTELNLQTYHNVNSVSIYDLDPSASTNNKVRVRCLLGVTGNVNDPRLTFDIDMPAGTSEERDILASATSTEEQRNLQFMFLLAIGRFYTYDVNAGQNDGLTPSTMESIVNSTVSGQINNLLSQVLDNEKVSISSNLSASSYLTNDATDLSNKELEGILEAHLLNNRLLVNGNFGYRENTINNTSNFIGDFEVKYLLLPRQGISIKGYNKSNDKYFSKATLTTQGVGLVFERDF